MTYDLAAIKHDLVGKKPGLALDIDDTLSYTWAYWAQELMRIGGNPENLTWQEVRRKYRRCEDVPYWQTEEIKQWMYEHRGESDYLHHLECVVGSRETVPLVHELYPIRLYLTARTDTSLATTRAWLDRHGFPNVPIVSRPVDVAHSSSYEWKSSILQALHPSIIGIVDDDAKLAEHISPDYPGTIYLIGEETYPREDVHIVHCPNWNAVHTALQQR